MYIKSCVYILFLSILCYFIIYVLHFYLTLIRNCRNKRQSFSNKVVVGCDLDYFLLFSHAFLQTMSFLYYFLYKKKQFDFTLFPFSRNTHLSMHLTPLPPRVCLLHFSLIFVCPLETWQLWGFSLNYLQSLPGMTIEWVAGRAQCAKRLSRISPISSSTCESSTEARTCRRRRVTFAARCSNTSIHCRRTCTRCIARRTPTPN